MQRARITQIDSEQPDDLVSFIQQARDKGASSWLNAMPFKAHDFDLNTEEFRDVLRLRYNLPLKCLQSFCAFGESFNVSNALS